MDPWLPSVAVVGATGAVGREMLAVLEQRKFPHRSIRVLASPKSAGSTLPYRGGSLTVEALSDATLKGIDIALFSAGSSISKQFAHAAAKHGTIIIDNSSAFRMDDGIPLVIPEVNPEALDPMVRSWRETMSVRRSGSAVPGGIVANPNCSTIIMLVPLHPLRRAFGVQRVVVSTYQAASGAGAKGMEELESQTREVLAGNAAVPQFFHEPYAFNLFSHNTAVDPETGLNVEERKMIDETHKIWNDRTVLVNPTCIRVPVLRAHSESITVELTRPATVDQVRAALKGAPGITVVDDRAANRFPTPLKASGLDDVFVGRIRPDPSVPPPPSPRADGPTEFTSFSLFVAGDQLRKGAALNAVQIAELFLK